MSTDAIREHFRNAGKKFETANSDITSIEQVYNTNFTGDEEQDEAIVDAIFDFIAADTTSMSDKIAAAKFLAPTFGENPEDIDEAFINDMLSETAATLSKAEKLKPSKWFGAKQLNPEQIIDTGKLERALIKANEKVKDSTTKFYANNLKIAKGVLDRISHLSKSKVRILSKTRKNGYLFIVFSVDKVLDFPYIKDRSGVRITKHGSKEYHLFVGDLNADY